MMLPQSAGTFAASLLAWCTFQCVAYSEMQPGVTGEERVAVLQAIGSKWNVAKNGTLETKLRESYFAVEAALKDTSFQALVNICIDKGLIERSNQTTGSPMEIRLSGDLHWKEKGMAHVLIAEVIRGSDGEALCNQVLLRGVFQKPLEIVRKEMPYPQGSLAATVLRLPHLEAKARSAPLLVKLDFGFGEIVEPGSSQKGRGFSVFVGLANNPKAEALGWTDDVLYRVLSGLDPVTELDRVVSKSIGKPFRSSGLEFYSPDPPRLVTPRNTSPAIYVSVESDRR